MARLRLVVLAMWCLMRPPNRLKTAVAIAGVLVFFALSLTAADTRAVKIMPLGDSITAGDREGGYRRLLYDFLTKDGINFKFVGSLRGGDVPDAHHEGHSGWRIEQIETGIDGGWLETDKPDVVLLHIGTNDIWQQRDLMNAPARLSALIDEVLSQSPLTRIIVAQILPMTNDPKFELAVRTYNAAIVDIVSSKSSTVCMVNMHDSFSAGDFIDGVHPTQSGYEKMARVWEPAIRAMIGAARPSEEGYHCGKSPGASSAIGKGAPQSE
jgi:lysophospholipase L1-like esterase